MEYTVPLSHDTLKMRQRQINGDIYHIDFKSPGTLLEFGY